MSGDQNLPAALILLVVVVVAVKVFGKRQTIAQPASGQRILVRAYRAGSQAAAAADFARDAEGLARQGYYPVSQNWAQGQWGCGAFLVALVLFLALIGILIFIYMILVKPEGSLTVTYERRQPTPPASVVADVPVTGDPVAALDNLAKMRDQGLISGDEFEAKKAEILRRM